MDRGSAIGWWINRGFCRSWHYDAIETPRIMFSCEGIQFVPLDRAKRIVRAELLKEAERLKELADSLLLPDQLFTTPQE